MNNNLISLIALIFAVFFSGIYLRSQSARKQEIKAEIELIRAQQEQIMLTVEEINRTTAAKDRILIDQIDSTKVVIEQLDSKAKISSGRIEERGEAIERHQSRVDSLRDSFGSEQIALASTLALRDTLTGL